MSFRLALVLTLIVMQLVFAGSLLYIFTILVRPELRAQAQESVLQRATDARDRLVDQLLYRRVRVQNWLDSGNPDAASAEALRKDLDLEALVLYRAEAARFRPDLAIGATPEIQASLAQQIDVSANAKLVSTSGQVWILFSGPDRAVALRVDLNKIFRADERFAILSQGEGNELQANRLAISALERERIVKLTSKGSRLSWTENNPKPGDEGYTVTPIPEFQVAMILAAEPGRMDAKWNTLLRLFLAAVLINCGLSLVIGLTLTGRLSSGLERLVQVTKTVAGGEFNVKLVETGFSELSDFGRSLRAMAAQLQTALAAKLHTVRLESELKTAEAVQSALLPSEPYSRERIEVAGFNRMASQCGGDLWGSWLTGDKSKFIYVLDVTGHGVASALISSAARASIATCERYETVSLNDVAALIDHSVKIIGKNRYSITGFIAQVDTETGVVSYLNLSHPAPYILKVNSNRSMKDIAVVPEHNNPPLGQIENVQSLKIDQLKLDPGDSLIVLTDGIFELLDVKQKPVTERIFIKHLVEVDANETIGKTAIDRLNQLVSQLMKTNQGVELKDDVTLVWMRR